MLKAVLGADKELYNFSSEELCTIKDELTLDNPKYLQAKRYSKYNNIRINPYIKYYRYNSKTKSISVPIGYKPPFRVKTIKDTRKERTVSYPPLAIKLRNTQQDAYRNYVQDTDKGIICLPTGKGKTVLGIYIAYKLKQKTLILVHKSDLVTGWKKDIEMCFNNNIEVGIYKAKKKVIGEQITIATVQTLNRLTPQELKDFTQNFGLVIQDELHHVGASIFNIISKFNCAYKLGLTATPERSDGLTKVMNFYLGDFAYVLKNVGKNDTDILPFRVVKRSCPFSYIPMCKLKNNKYVLDERGTIPITEVPYRKRPQVPYTILENEVVLSKEYSQMYLSDITNEYKKDRSILVLVKQKLHCEYIKQRLLERGIPSENVQLYYGDSKEPKETLIKRAETQRNLITIATLSVATEGTNVKQWEVLFLVSSIADGKNLEQAIGRIRRTTNKPKLKEVLVYDYSLPKVYTMANHVHAREVRYKQLLNTKSNTFSRGFR